MKIQSIIFKNSHYDIDNVIKFFDRNRHIKPIKLPDYTKNAIRVRIEDPKEFEKLRAKVIKPGLVFIFGE
jgi:hypothetical protein